MSRKRTLIDFTKPRRVLRKRHHPKPDEVRPLVPSLLMSQAALLKSGDVDGAAGEIRTGGVGVSAGAFWPTGERAGKAKVAQWSIADSLFPN